MRELLMWTSQPGLPAPGAYPSGQGAKKERGTQRRKDAKTPRNIVEDFAPFAFPWGGALRLAVLAFFP
jgi:hypothetical protein